MKKIIAFVFCLALCSLVLNAQNVRGNVVDEKNAPLGFSTVALIALPDTTILGGCMTEEDGSFDLPVADNVSIVQISMIGYKTVDIPVTEFSGPRTVKLFPDTEVLEGAVVSVQLPRTELKGDAVATNISGSVLEHAGNAFDVLSKIPGLISNNGTMEVIGRGAPVYYLNGRKITDMSELRDLMSEDIKSVEVISNPGSLYGGDVRSVVRIRTVKHQGDGFSFAFTSQAMQKIYKSKDFIPSWSVLDLNYRVKGWDFFAKLVYWENRNYQYSDLTCSTYIIEDGGYLSHVQDGTLEYQNHRGGIQYVFGANWQINDNHSFGFKIDRGKNNFNSGYTLTDNDVIINDVVEDHLNSLSEETSPYGNQWSGNIYYDGNVGKLNINFNADFVYGHEQNNADIRETSWYAPVTIQSETKGEDALGAGKLILSHPVGKGKILAGAEETYVVARQQYNVTKQEIPSSDAAISENIIAGFAEYALPFSFGQFSAGLRYEHMDIRYYDYLNSSTDERHSDNWFPNLNFSAAAGPVNLSLSYTGKTIRPNYSQISTEIIYINRFCYQSGNPKLYNEARRTFSLNANWKWLTFSGNYERVDNLIVMWITPYDDQGIMMLKPDNLSKPFRLASFYLNAAPTIGCWYPRYTVGIEKQFLNITVVDPRAEGGKRDLHLNDPMYLVQANNAFRFKHSWELDADYVYTSPMHSDVTLVYKPMQTFSLSVQKSFLKNDALTIRFSWTDIFNSYVVYSKTDYGSYDIQQSYDRRNPCLLLRVSYRFNSASNKYKGTGAGQSAKDRL